VTYDLHLPTGKAWAFKEMLRDLWSQDTATSATSCFKDWYNRVIHTRLAPLKTVARSIKERLTNVVSKSSAHCETTALDYDAQDGRR
jgi:transposase